MVKVVTLGGNTSKYIWIFSEPYAERTYRLHRFIFLYIPTPFGVKNSTANLITHLIGQKCFHSRWLLTISKKNQIFLQRMNFVTTEVLTWNHLQADPKSPLCPFSARLYIIGKSPREKSTKDSHAYIWESSVSHATPELEIQLLVSYP